MRSNAKPTRANVIPALRYHDAPAAIDWLCEAFGFERRLVVPGEDGGVAHAQLVFGNGMIMLGSARDDDFGKLVRPPTAGVGTQSPYVIVEDADEHCARAVAAGAEIVRELQDEDYGGRGYSCRDPEGHLWNFGTYDPWEPADEPSAQLRDRREALVRRHMQAENVHDFDSVIETFAHPRYELIPSGAIHDGESAVREYFRETRSAFPDQRNELIALRHADDAVIAEFWLLGTHRGKLLGIEPTGKAFRCQMAALFLFEGEQLVCERVYFDAATILRQLTA